MLKSSIKIATKPQSCQIATPHSRRTTAWVVLPALKTITLMHTDGKIQNYNEDILLDDAVGFEIDLIGLFSRF